MHILTPETTCDETAAAVINDRLEVLGAVVASQDALHQRFGGVVPEIASRAHVERILPVIDETLKRAGLSLAELDAIAVANTPGLAGSLLVGLAAAKGLAVATGKPLVAVNHLQAHIYACRIASGEEVFPCLGLIVSRATRASTAAVRGLRTAGSDNRRRRRRGLRQGGQYARPAVSGRPRSNGPRQAGTRRRIACPARCSRTITNSISASAA